MAVLTVLAQRTGLFYGRTDRSRTENWPVCLGEEAPSGEDLEYLDEIERERNYEFGFCECQVRRDSNRSI